MKKVRCLLIIVVILFATGIVTTQSYANIDPKTILTSLSFDEGSGTVAKDSSGNGNDGTIVGATWVNGMGGIGKALQFDGVGNYVMVGIKGSIPQSLTLAAWIYPTLGGVIFSELEVEALDSPWHDAQMEVLPTGEIAASFWTADNQINGITLGTFPLNQWYYVVMTYDKDNKNTLSGYVNGEFKQSLSLVKAYPSGLWYGIGSADSTSRTGGGKFFTGIIDKVGIYNVALSADDVKQSYQQTIGAASAVLPADKLATTWSSIKTR
jgi:hypothetical protein